MGIGDYLLEIPQYFECLIALLSCLIGISFGASVIGLIKTSRQNQLSTILWAVAATVLGFLFGLVGAGYMGYTYLRVFYSLAFILFGLLSSLISGLLGSLLHLSSEEITKPILHLFLLIFATIVVIPLFFFSRFKIKTLPITSVVIGVFGEPFCLYIRYWHKGLAMSI
jgi:pilus assembly protein TadC